MADRELHGITWNPKETDVTVVIAEVVLVVVVLVILFVFIKTPTIKVFLYIFIRMNVWNINLIIIYLIVEMYCFYNNSYVIAIIFY